MLIQLALTHLCGETVLWSAGSYTDGHGAPISACPGCRESLGTPFVRAEEVHPCRVESSTPPSCSVNMLGALPAVAGVQPQNPGGFYVVGWIEETREICALRSPLVPPWLRLALESAFSSALLGDGATIEFLGWADDREALDRALSGWE